MNFTEADREALNGIWMSQKAKMRLTQMEIVKKLGLTQLEFSNYLRGAVPLNITFIERLCRIMHVEPALVIPSLKVNPEESAKVVYLKTTVNVDGAIQNAYIDGNQVVIEYAHLVN
ncbi:helix-turn-helix transcriptional regulator [Vibrio hannami]|uniref:helix-turn-helix domain-containing protein n=1 Tax=Vibrio hannami TaxID=2717094 RepID=UPI002410A9B3|nr:helix-turn-helix transcriptional regulator [Vibrio hannami]MDG3086385.1 helix-turn-helix transcriptional regulator [Vibrio hannami]